jgi:hypothetical protein
MSRICRGGSTGATLEKVRQNIREAIEFHLEGMRKTAPDGDPNPTLAIAYFLKRARAMQRENDKRIAELRKSDRAAWMGLLRRLLEK